MCIVSLRESCNSRSGVDGVADDLDDGAVVGDGTEVTGVDCLEAGVHVVRRGLLLGGRGTRSCALISFREIDQRKS